MLLPESFVKKKIINECCKTRAMYEIHVFNKILGGRHFSEEKGKEEAIKDNFDFTLRLIHSMSDITNISPRCIQNTHARVFCLLNHVKIKSEVTTT